MSLSTTLHNNHDDNPFQLDCGDHVGIGDFYAPLIIRLRKSKLKQVYLPSKEYQNFAGRVISNRRDEQKD